jgi:hypothetical protein
LRFFPSRNLVKIPKVVSVEPWPEADRLFRTDPLWLGSDDAYSIPLSGDRVLWLFGDTFVAPRPGAVRRECSFVRNSIGIQQGLDPSRASISFHWGEDDGPTDFFADDAGWLWPLHGALLGGRLLLFFMKVRSPQAASGGIDEWMDSDSLSFFEVYGWGARLVHNPDDSPVDWKVEDLVCPTNDIGIVLGAAALVEDVLYLWGWTQERDGYLARLRINDAAAGDFSGLQWWSRDGRWNPKPQHDEVALDQAQTEFTVHRHRSVGELFQVQAMGLSPADLTIRWTSVPTGPWSEILPFFRIPESERERVIAYAGKAHPHLAGAHLVLTYASNGDAADVTLDDDTIYYPRFVKVALSND